MRISFLSSVFGIKLSIILYSLVSAILLPTTAAQSSSVYQPRARVYNGTLFYFNTFQKRAESTLYARSLSDPLAKPKVFSTRLIGACTFEMDRPRIICMQFRSDGTDMRVISLIDGIADETYPSPAVNATSNTPAFREGKTAQFLL